MDSVRTDPFHGVFAWHPAGPGQARLSRHPSAPSSLPDPHTGRALRIETVDVAASATCPGCASQGSGGYISFVADLRMVYACPACRQLVWVNGF